MHRRAIVIHGIVQGVGFRPFVYGLALRHDLHGFVKNIAGDVQIEVEGKLGDLDRFLEELRSSPPPLAKINRVDCREIPLNNEAGFRIAESETAEAGEIVISPDIATCEACLAEMMDPRNRRYRYPFLNCTNCGPRLTIVRAAPYDRKRTTMAGFEMCDACRQEYEDPRDRRFHAQPTACAECGPRLMLCDSEGKMIETGDPVAACCGAIKAGKIVAIKGLGGYHLACDALNDDAIRELRRRKHRDEKPFAIMVGDAAGAKNFCDVSSAEEQLLCSKERPIVLLKRRADVAEPPRSIAPGNPHVGVMLPYTPLHHLLFSALSANHSALIMTSGNRSDEPIATGEPEVFERLRGIADLFLTTNRAIHLRCDDSVVRVIERDKSFIRRSRGYAPSPIALPIECERPILAVGGQLKNTFALGRGNEAILSHHIGDLDHYLARAAFERDIALYEELFEVRPRVIAHDLHPDYGSSVYARARAERDGSQLVGVQHHHAHMASCMAEHGLTQRVIGICFDGTGYGLDGAIWGGEFFVGDLWEFQRVAHLRYVPMPGGEAAIKQPWRMALAYSRDAGIDSNFANEAAPRVAKMIEKGINCPATSSMGRLFDAVASLIGLRDEVSFEGQAAMELEAIAERAETDERYEFTVVTPSAGTLPGEIDLRTMIREIVEDVRREVSRDIIVRKFHNTLAHLASTICIDIREKFSLDHVVLSGGCFMNSRLSTRIREILSAAGFRVFAHRMVPPNDGGISLGQIAVAAARMNLTKGEDVPGNSWEGDQDLA